MPFSVMPLPFKPHKLNGLTDKLLLSHYENNYGGAVRRLNAIEERLRALNWTVASAFEINGLKREQLVALNSAILHEIYFDGLSETAGDGPAGDLADALERDFGSIDRWKGEFTATAKAQAGGSGWTVLTWSPRTGRLVNAWGADHCFGLADGIPLLAIDMYEHAYHRDFGAKAAAYVDTTMMNLAWDRIGARYTQAAATRPAPASRRDEMVVTVDELREQLAGRSDVVVLDVCHRDDLARKTDALPGARWVDPMRIADWVESIPKGMPVVTYCLYGFQISQNATAELRRLGVDARLLAGGIASWRANGQPTDAFVGPANE